MDGWMDTRPILFVQMDMMKMHDRYESIPIFRGWKMTESKRMTYNILGVSMLCQLASLVIGSDERGDIPNKHNWGIN